MNENMKFYRFCLRNFASAFSMLTFFLLVRNMEALKYCAGVSSSQIITGTDEKGVHCIQPHTLITQQGVQTGHQVYKNKKEMLLGALIVT